MSDYAIAKIDDVADLSGDAPGEFRMLTEPLEGEQLALSHRVIPADFGGILGERTGHSHRTQEEIYYVISGTLQVKVGDEVLAIGPRTAIRIAPAATRAVWNDGPEQVEMLMLSTRVEDLSTEVEMVLDFWEAGWARPRPPAEP